MQTDCYNFMEMKKQVKNPAAVALGKLGGSATSPAKIAACRRNAEKRWNEYRAKQQSNAGK